MNNSEHWLSCCLSAICETSGVARSAVLKSFGWFVTIWKQLFLKAEKRESRRLMRVDQACCFQSSFNEAKLRGLLNTATVWANSLKLFPYNRAAITQLSNVEGTRWLTKTTLFFHTCPTGSGTNSAPAKSYAMKPSWSLVSSSDAKDSWSCF